MKIVGIDTLQLKEIPWVTFVQVHSDQGVVGVSDTYYAGDAICAYVHSVLFPALVGRDPLAIEAIWFDMYQRSAARWGGTGVEMRALSAVDSCLWDILGQTLGVPIYQLLGGLARPRIRTYNTCGGPTYGKVGTSRTGDGPGPLEDLWSQFHEPAALAEELLNEGYTGMKIWPFDRYSLAGDGQHISAAQLTEGVGPLRAIREAVGDRMEIMVEGHGYWDLPSAKKIALAVEEFRPAWLEDLVLAHDIEAIAELKGYTRTPIIASELLITKHQFVRLLERRACDIIMLDPTWAGGITESRKIVTLSEAFGLPIAMHDCTGPFTLLAGVHLALSAPNAIYQESVRASIRTWYTELVPNSVEIVDGHILPPVSPGIGTYLLPEVFERADAVIQVSVA
jgi:L-alanine-DL-glutamate epimerase-like enolase superfamily enzyme